MATHPTVRLVGLAVLVVGAASCSRGARTDPAADAVPTFNKDVAPIVFANCAPCHRPGGVGPFSLLTYADASAHADAIVEQTTSRHMPPWLPDRGEVPFVGERRLRDEQIRVLERWANGGRPEGAAADRREPPSFSGGWELGTPDVVLRPDRAFVLKPGQDDVYRNLVVATALPSGKFVRAVEFRPEGAPIHHAVVRMDVTSGARRRDGVDGQPGFEGMAWGSVQDPDGHFVGWAPGRGPIVAPDRMPWRIERGADLVVEVHLIGTPAPVDVRPSIGLYFTDQPPVRVPVTVRMGSKLIDIPAGASAHEVADSYRLPVAVDLMSVYPHAHFLGREMTVTATLPDGAVKTLIHIPHWNFHWQQDYRYAVPVPLPAGTMLSMRYVYDNSTANPHNPRTPPVRVRSGPKSTDEMAEFGLQVLPKSAADARRLLEEFAARDLQANLAMAEARAREEPGSGDYRALYGSTLVDAGRMDEAIGHLEAALRLGHSSPGTWNSLGMARMAVGRMPQAVQAFERAIALAPRDENLHFNLGNAHGRMAKPGDAAAAYERALAINPEFVDAHVNLGLLLFSRRQLPDAIARFERAAALRPDSAVTHGNLGAALAAAGRFDDARRHLRRALEIDPANVAVQQNLARVERGGR